MRLLPAACLMIPLCAAPLAAQESQASLSIELNAAEPAAGACRLSFLVENTHGEPITEAVFEAVLFDTEGRVERLTLLDFGALPPGRPRVRQFILPETDCDALGRLLLNGANRCEAPGLDAGICEHSLRPSSRTGIEVLG